MKKLLIFMSLIILFGCESNEIKIETKMDGYTSTFITSLNLQADYYDYYSKNGELYVDACQYEGGQNNCELITHQIDLDNKKVIYDVDSEDIGIEGTLWVDAPTYDIYRKYDGENKTVPSITYYYVSNDHVEVLLEYNVDLHHSKYIEVSYDPINEKTYVSFPSDNECVIYEVNDGTLEEVNKIDIYLEDLKLNYISFHSMSAVYNTNSNSEGITKIYSNNEIYEFKNYDREYFIGDYLFIEPANINEPTRVINLQTKKEKTLDKAIPMSWHDWTVSKDQYSYIYYSNADKEYMFSKFDGDSFVVTPLVFGEDSRFIQIDEFRYVFIAKNEKIDDIYLLEIE